MTVSVREVGGLDCIGPGLTMTQWMNRMMLQSGPVHQATMQYTEKYPPSRLIEQYIIGKGNFLQDFMKIQKHLNDYFWQTEQPQSWRLCLISSGLDDLWSVHDWMTLSSPLHVTFPLPGGSSHFNLTLNWLFIHSVQVSKSLGITFQLETFKDQYSNSWMIALVIKIQGVFVSTSEGPKGYNPLMLRGWKVMVEGTVYGRAPLSALTGIESTSQEEQNLLM